MTVTATDPDSPSLTYSINGGADAAKFAINSTTGALTFVSAPDFDEPYWLSGLPTMFTTSPCRSRTVR